MWVLFVIVVILRKLINGTVKLHSVRDCFHHQMEFSLNNLTERDRRIFHAERNETKLPRRMIKNILCVQRTTTDERISIIK